MRSSANGISITLVMSLIYNANRSNTDRREELARIPGEGGEREREGKIVEEEEEEEKEGEKAEVWN